jgi:hypothetical protein
MTTASSQTALGSSTFYLNGFDGNDWYSLGLGLTVTSAPLQVSTRRQVTRSKDKL